MERNKFPCEGPESPCKDCEFRHMNCHSECEAYQQYVVDRIEYRRKKCDVTRGELLSIIQQRDMIRKRMKKHRR